MSKIMNTSITKSIFLFVFSFVTLSVFAKDTVPPTITLNKGKQQNVDINSIFMLNEPKSVSDNQTDSSDILVKLQWLTGPVNTMSRGKYSLAIEAKDTSGNTSRDTVHYFVDDFILPVINLNTPNTVCAELGKPYNRILPDVSDNYYPKNQVSLVLVSSDVNTNMIGLYSDVYQATDGSGNKTTRIRVVEVKQKCNSDIDMFNEDFQLSCFPNPANDAMNIKTNFDVHDATLKIYDVKGELVLSIAFSNVLDVSYLNNGLYSVCLSNGQYSIIRMISITHF